MLNEENHKVVHLMDKAIKFLSEENSLLINSIFYDVLKLIYYRVKRKSETGKGKRLLKDVQLKVSEITEIFLTVDYLHKNLNTFDVDEQLRALFGSNHLEDDYLKYFEHFLEGELTDRYGRLINVPTEGIKCMYKDSSGKHVIDSSFFEPTRGKRLPWIKHTIQNSACILRRTVENKETLLYITKYRIPIDNSQTVIDTFLVVVKRNRLGKNDPYEFKTAFTVPRHNHLLKTIEGFHPAIIKK